MKRKTFLILLGISAAILTVLPVLATATYIYSFTLQETGGVSYTLAPIYAAVNNTALASNKYISSSGLDTRVTSGGTELKRMLTTAGLWMLSPINASRTVTDYYTFGNTPDTAMPMILGNGGYVTVADAAALEPATNFSLQVSGNLDTTSPNYFALMNNNTNGSGTTHTINLPTGYQAGDLLIVFIGTSAATSESGWTQSFTELFDGAYLACAYKVAAGTEGTSITVTSASTCTSSCQAYAIRNYTGVPAAGILYTTTGANPDPPTLNPAFNAVNTLWLTVVADAQNLTAYPTYFTNKQTTGTTPYLNTSYAYLGSGTFKDPDVYTAASGAYGVNTVAINIKPKTIIGKADEVVVAVDPSTSGTIDAVTTGNAAYVAMLTGSSGNDQLCSIYRLRAGEKYVNLPAGTYRVTIATGSNAGSPTGTVSYVARKVSDDSIIATIGTESAASVTSHNHVAGTFTNPTTQNVYILTEFSGGDGANYIQIWQQATNVYAGGSYYNYYSGAYHETATKEQSQELDLIDTVTTATKTNVASGDQTITVRSDGTLLSIDTVGNMLYNANMENYIGTTTLEWTQIRALAQPSTTQAKIGTYSMKVTANDGTGAGDKAVTQSLPFDTSMRGKTYTVGLWVWNSTSNNQHQYLCVTDSSASWGSAVEFVKNNTWTWVTLSRTLPNDATSLTVQLDIDNGTGVNTTDYMYIDGITCVEASSVAQTTASNIPASVPLKGYGIVDTSNNWLINQNDAYSYINFVKMSVANTVIAWYEPNTMISGTTLPDRQGGDQNATITFGSSTANLTLTFTTLLPSAQSNLSSSGAGLNAGSIVSGTAIAPPQLYTELDTSKVPGGAAISEILVGADVPEALWWFPFIYIGIIILGLLAYEATQGNPMATTRQGVNSSITVQSYGYDGSLLVLAIVDEVLLILFGVLGTMGVSGMIPLFGAILFPIPAIAMIMSRKHQSWG